MKLRYPPTRDGLAQHLQECGRRYQEDLERVLGHRPGESWFRREIRQLSEDKRASEEKRDK